MKYLYSWLKEHYPEIPSVAELEPLLIQIGHDVEAIEPIDYEGVVIAEITSVDKHPNADRLSMVNVTTGKATHRVVCGAPDLKVGQKVAYAGMGATLPCGLTLKPITIRGEASDGMLCAEDELAIGPSHASLLSIPRDAKVGEPLKQYVQPDAVFHLDITSDRGDVLSHFGLARDLAAAKEQKLLTPNFTVPHYQGETSESVTIEALHPDARAFTLGLVTTEKSAATPLIMQARLHLVGQKSINLATDITNYLVLEYGQPLHAYDADKLGDKPVFSVRRAKQSEAFSGLNGKTYELSPQALIITNHDTPVGLAGILGGEDTKVTDKTTRVLFESAHFYPKPVRVMARGLNLLTEGALRWERGVNFNLMEPVRAHAQAMYAELTGGTSPKPVTKENPAHDTPSTTELSAKEASEYIGTYFAIDQTEKILTGLGIDIQAKDKEVLTVQAPSWRFDLAIPEDYYEELVRMVGLHNLKKQALPASVPQWKRSRWWRQEALKDTLVALGASEISTYPFVSNEELELFPTKLKAIELRESAFEGKDYLRVSLAPGMIQAIAANPEAPNVILFEIAKVYTTDGEIDMLAISVSGQHSAEVDAWWQNMFERLHLPVASWMSRVQTIPDDVKAFYKVRKSMVTILTLPVGDLLQAKQFENPTVAIPDLDEIKYLPLSKYQASRRDIAFVVDRSITPDQVIRELRALDPAIVDIELFDIYTDNKLGDNKHSLAFHLLYQAPDKTFTSDEIQTIHQKVEAHIQENYHGTIR